MKNKYTMTAAAVALGVLCASAPATATAAQKPASAKPGTAAHQTVAMKFSKAGEAWGEILAERKALAAAVKTNNLAEVHDIAFAIRDAVVTLPYKSDALSASKKAALAKRVQEVAAIATEIDRVADAGDAAKTKIQHARLLKSLAAIEALYPANALPSEGARPMSAAEKALFLTPGGKYTADDIRANGDTSVYQKHPGYVASHSTEVMPGEMVCPISETRPDPKLTWVVGGKTYQFCCPPCVAEFVQKAKTAPASVKPPEQYVKR